MCDESVIEHNLSVTFVRFVFCCVLIEQQYIQVKRHFTYRLQERLMGSI